jgi:hypothetical protein
MTKKLFLSVALLAMMIPANAWVRTSHYIQFWGEGGARQYHGEFKNSTPQLGFLGGVGMGYEYRVEWFVINTGVGFAVPSFRLNVEDMTSSFYGPDDEGDMRKYEYVQTGRVERYNGFNIQVPFTIGIQLKKFYMLLGAKGDFNIFSASHLRANISSQGVYDDFMPTNPDMPDPFVDMPEHSYYSGQVVRQSHGMRFRPDVQATIELGWRLGNPTLATGWDVHKSKWQYRIGFFFDYGLLNCAPKIKYNGGIITVPDQSEAGLNNIKLQDVIGSNGWYGKIQNFTVGAKFTALFHVTPWWNCLVCEQVAPRAKPQKGERNWKW